MEFTCVLHIHYETSDGFSFLKLSKVCIKFMYIMNILLYSYAYACCTYSMGLIIILILVTKQLYTTELSQLQKLKLVQMN